ncbi:MAG: hypothetical protein ACOX8S_10540 [Christensenellales bacterium]|jgi:hypothetical protein
MAKIESKILYDKTEIVVVDLSGKRAQALNLTYDKIVSIQFDNSTFSKLFKKVPSEKITITIRGRETPVVFFEELEKKYWDQYKSDLTKFAKDNRISFRNNLE